MSIILEFLALLIFGFLVFLTHKNIMETEVFEKEDFVKSIESIDEKLKNSFNSFILKILIRVKILVLQLSNFLENTIQKINKNATKKDKVS
jgi:hypothetical protein